MSIEDTGKKKRIYAFTIQFGRHHSPSATLPHAHIHRHTHTHTHIRKRVNEGVEEGKKKYPTKILPSHKKS